MPWTIASYNATPSGNTAINGINISEGCNASGINDAIRQLMGDIATQAAGTAAFNAMTLAGALTCNGSGTTNGTITAGDGGAFHARGFGATADLSSTALNTSGTFSVVAGGSGGVQLTSGATSWASISDERVKTTLTSFESPLAKIASLRAGTGRYIRDLDGPSRSFLIAQDVRKVLPEAVDEDEQGYLSLRYTDIVPLLVAAVTELRDEVAALKAVA